MKIVLIVLVCIERKWTLGPSQVPLGTPSVAHMVDSHGETLEQREPPQTAGHEPVQKMNSDS